MKVKGMLTAALVIAAMLLPQTTAKAVDMEYSGPINSFTNEPMAQTETVGREDWVPISSGVYYDQSKRVYTYTLGSATGGTVSSSVMDGMIVSESVRIAASEGLELRLHRNGKPLENADLSLIQTTGQYVLEAKTLGDQYVRVMGFTIVGATTGLISSYPMPAGFIITNVEMKVRGEDGELVSAKPKWDRSKVSLSENGIYRVEYECARNGVKYTLQTEIDHTPPKLALANVVNGLARGPVDISDLEEGCKIGITLNGGEMKYRKELTLSGDYEILLVDEAGNVTNYAFTILVYFDINSWIFFALVLLAVSATGIYLYMERKRVRIR